MATKKIQVELDNITRFLSKMVGVPCRWHESDLGGRFSVWKSNEDGALIERLIGFASIKELWHQFYIFQRAWNMAKHQNE